MLYDITDKRHLGDLVLESAAGYCGHFPDEFYKAGLPFGFSIEVKASDAESSVYACVRTIDRHYTHFLYFRKGQVEFHIDECFLATGDTAVDRVRLNQVMSFADSISYLLAVEWRFLSYDDGKRIVRERIVSLDEAGDLFTRYLETLTRRADE